mmetsp:Transcript_18088/g.41133  ORF Transcript_18088/g.41133 Transcript_18088/m.41133 type:complete len:301 (-) Transcript_18088:175-1077(-)
MFVFLSFQVEKIQSMMLDYKYFEELNHFKIHQTDAFVENIKHCIAIERPFMTLHKLVSTRNDDPNKFPKYIYRVTAILRLVAKGLTKLHRKNLVHGNLGLYCIGMFQNKQWKITSTCGILRSGDAIPLDRFANIMPPEYIDFPGHDEGGLYHMADPGMDVWNFGRLVYEAFVGEPRMFSACSKDKSDLQKDSPKNGGDCNNDDKDDVSYTKLQVNIATWDKDHIHVAIDRLASVKVLGIYCADMVRRCLCTNPHGRPKMTEILDHSFWEDMRTRRGEQNNTATAITVATMQGNIHKGKKV